MIFLTVQKYDETRQIHIRVDPWMKTGRLLHDLARKQKWNQVQQLYCQERGCYLDLEFDFDENRIVYGDHLIAC